MAPVRPTPVPRRIGAGFPLSSLRDSGHDVSLLARSARPSGAASAVPGLPGSDSCPAAVDRDDRAGDVARPVRHDERDDRSDRTLLANRASNVAVSSSGVGSSRTLSRTSPALRQSIKCRQPAREPREPMTLTAGQSTAKSDPVPRLSAGVVATLGQLSSRGTGPAPPGLPGSASTPLARRRAASSAQRPTLSRAVAARYIRPRSAPAWPALRYSPADRLVVPWGASYRAFAA